MTEADFTALQAQYHANRGYFASDSLEMAQRFHDAILGLIEARNSGQSFAGRMAQMETMEPLLDRVEKFILGKRNAMGEFKGNDRRGRLRLGGRWGMD